MAYQFEKPVPKNCADPNLQPKKANPYVPGTLQKRRIPDSLLSRLPAVSLGRLTLSDMVVFITVLALLVHLLVLCIHISGKVNAERPDSVSSSKESEKSLS
jgi:hypothetical protein